MLEVRDDNAEAFAELMLRYQKRIVSRLTHLAGLCDQSEDLAQEVFLRVYRARKRYVPGSKFSTWLYTIAHNVASNALRSRARRKEVNLAPAGSGELATDPLDYAAVASSGLAPTRQLDKAELRVLVQLAGGELSERKRMAVLLNKFEHLSYEEIGEVMNMSGPAVKSLLSRARANLRQVLEPYLQDGMNIGKN